MSTTAATLEFSTLGVIGPGRMGSALAESLSLQGYPIHAIAGRGEACPKARALAQRVHARIVSAQALAETCSLIFIATPDDAIAPLADTIEWSAGSAVVHLSGATDVQALQAAQHCQAHIGGFHPLQSISQAAGTATTFQHCTITIEAEHEALSKDLATLAHALGSHVNILPPNTRMRYHAAANHASALLVALMTDMARLWESWGSSEKDMMDALLPLMQNTLSAARERGVTQALTGPLARGDVGTLEGHLAALEQLDPALARRYAVRHQPLLTQAPDDQRQQIAALINAYAAVNTHTS